MTRESRHALVIGAGVAGPATALFLKKIGITSTVYEPMPPTHGVGGGLVLAPNGMNVLAELGLADEVKERGSLVLENRFYTEAGHRIARLSNGGARYGQPAVALMRDELHRLLLEELAARGILVRFGKRLAKVERNDGTKIIARFSDETTAEGELLIGADGVESRVRKAVFREAPAPSFTGVVGMGGVTAGAAVPRLSAEDKQSLTFTFGARGFFGYCGARGGDVMWWSQRRRERPFRPAELEDRSREAIHEELRGTYGGYHAPIGALIENTEAPVKMNVFDVETLPRWRHERVVLIGDAAHAVSPTSGHGASLALEDAMDLAKQLRDDAGDHRRAFEAYERDRRARVARIVADGRRRGATKAKVSRIQAQLRNVAMWLGLNLFGERSQDWVYRYRVDWNAGAAR